MMKGHRSVAIWLLIFGFVATYCQAHEEAQVGTAVEPAFEKSKNDETVGKAKELHSASFDDELYGERDSAEYVRTKRVDGSRKIPLPNEPPRQREPSPRGHRRRSHPVTAEHLAAAERLRNRLRDAGGAGPSQGPIGAGPSRGPGGARPSQRPGGASPSRQQRPGGASPSRRQGPGGASPSRRYGPGRPQSY